MKILSLSLLIASALFTSAAAENYKLIASNKAQLPFADADAPISKYHNIVTHWSIVLRAPNYLLPGDVAIVKMLNEFDCAAHVWRATAMTSYRKDYSLVENSELTKERWRPIPPDTQNSELEKFACRTLAYRASLPSVGKVSLAKIISSVYAGPWPAK